MRIFQGTRIDLADNIEIGAGLTLNQNATGIPLLTGTGGAATSMGSGTEALPGLPFSADAGLDTGIYWPGEDQFGISTGGVARLILNNTAALFSVRHEFNSGLQGAPTFTALSSGVRASLFPGSLGAADVTHSIGVESGAIWYAAGSVTNSHKWYGGQTEWMRLFVEGMDNAKLVINPGITPTITDTPTKGLSIRISSNDTGTIHHLGTLSYAEQTAATVQSIQALEGYAVTRNTSGSVILAVATIGNVDHNGAGGTLTFGTGIRGGCTVRAGTMTEGAALYAQAPAILGGSMGTAYGLYLDAITGAGTNYQIWSDGTAPSMFAGPLQATILFAATGGSASAPTFAFGNNPDSGMYASSTVKVSLAANGTQVFDATSTSVNIPVSFQVGGGTLISTSNLIPLTNGTPTISGGWTITGTWAVSGTWGMAGTWTIDTNGSTFKFSEIATTGVVFDHAQTVDSDQIKININTSGTAAPGLIAVERQAVRRWRFGVNGSASGNLFNFFSYNDAGTFVATVMQLARSGNDPVSIFVNGALKQITVDAVDTAGAGFRALRVPN